MGGRINFQRIAGGALEHFGHGGFGHILAAEIDEACALFNGRYGIIGFGGIVELENNVGGLDVINQLGAGDVHDRPDEIPGARLVRIKGDGRALVTRYAAPCAPCLGKEIEAEPDKNAVQERQVRNNPVPGFLHQDRTLVVFEIRDPETL